MGRSGSHGQAAGMRQWAVRGRVSWSGSGREAVGSAWAGLMVRQRA